MRERSPSSLCARLLAAFERRAGEHLAEPISIADAARALGVSERTLQRTPRRTLGTSPVRVVQDLRSATSTPPRCERTGATAGTLRGR